MPEIRVYRNPTNTKSVLTKQVRGDRYSFLKYWRVVRYWAKRKYNISMEELEVILYLYDMDLFTRKQFIKFEGLLTWDKTRFNHFIEKGWVIVWREHKGYSKQAKMYTLSVGAKRMCASIYKKLLQEEHISENANHNPVFTGSSYADKMYRKAIRAMNKETKSKE